MTAERLALTPDVPTMREAGLDIVFGSWTALAAPKALPDAVYDKLSTALKAMYDDARFQQFAADNGLILDYIPGPEFAEILKAESEKVKEILRAQGHIR
jgi:tripartite-type tricarboxylate transporter receptor subunit TctC